MYRAVEKYVVRLTTEERAELEAMTRQRRIASDKQLRAKLLLHADEGEWGPAYLDEQLVEEIWCESVQSHAAPATVGIGRFSSGIIAAHLHAAPPAQTRWRARSEACNPGV